MKNLLLTLSLLSFNLLPNSLERSHQEREWQRFQLNEESFQQHTIEALDHQSSILQQEIPAITHAPKKEMIADNFAWYNPMEYVYRGLGYMMAQAVLYALDIDSSDPKICKIKNENKK